MEATRAAVEMRKRPADSEVDPCETSAGLVDPMLVFALSALSALSSVFFHFADEVDTVPLALPHASSCFMFSLSAVRAQIATIDMSFHHDEDKEGRIWVLCKNLALMSCVLRYLEELFEARYQRTARLDLAKLHRSSPFPLHTVLLLHSSVTNTKFF